MFLDKEPTPLFYNIHQFYKIYLYTYCNRTFNGPTWTKIKYFDKLHNPIIKFTNILHSKFDI